MGGKSLFESTKVYSDSKKCWSPDGSEPPLGNIPQLIDLYSEADNRFARLDAYLHKCEMELSACLRADKIPPTPLVEAIAVAKVSAVEDTIALCFRLKQDVGSFALMGGSGFEQMDFLQCCKFAEGDSRILMQKMARDIMRSFSKTKGKPAGASEPEIQLCGKLANAMQSGSKTAWD